MFGKFARDIVEYRRVTGGITRSIRARPNVFDLSIHLLPWDRQVRLSHAGCGIGMDWRWWS